MRPVWILEGHLGSQGKGFMQSPHLLGQLAPEGLLGYDESEIYLKQAALTLASDTAAAPWW